MTATTTSARERRPAAPAPDRPDERERHEDERPELRGDCCAEEGPAEPVTLRQQRRDRGGREQRRPEVEAAEDQRADQQRRDARRRTRPRAGRRRRRTRARRRSRHQPGERAGVVAERRRRDEGRQRARRILDREVAIGNAPVVQDRVAVGVVRRPVDELAVRPEPAVHEPPAGEEEARGGEAPQPTAGAGASTSSPFVSRQSRRGAARPARGRRTGRTTAGRDRTSASGRARSRRAPRR